MLILMIVEAISDNCLFQMFSCETVLSLGQDSFVDRERPFHIDTDNLAKLHVCNVSLDSFQQKVLLLVHEVCPQSSLVQECLDFCTEPFSI